MHIAAVCSNLPSMEADEMSAITKRRTRAKGISQSPNAVSAPHSDWVLLKTSPAARFIGVKEQTLAKWRCIGWPGQPPYLKISSLVYYERAALEVWLRKRERGSVA
jgi:hypothetical protein